MASNWELLAKNHIGNRAWSDIARAWAAAAIGFDLSRIQDISAAVTPILSPDFADRENVSVFNFPGRRIAAFMDAACATIKAAYILRNTGVCVLGGQPTWAALDAYHFSLVSARAILGLLGVHFVHILDSYAVLDVFPEGETERERRQFSVTYRSVNEPCRLILRSRSSVIEQRAIWTIFLRTLRVTTFESDLQNHVNRIIELGEGFGAARNELLYQNVAWIYDQDYIYPSIPDRINDDPFDIVYGNDFFEDKDSNFAFAALLLHIMRSLISSVEALSGSNIVPTSYGSVLKKFLGFDPAKLHSVFSSVYRKDNYGITL